jgi:flagellar biosynthetic protein FliS
VKPCTTASVTSASPSRVLDEVLARLLVDVYEARARILAADAAGKAKAVGHALALVDALTAALDHAAAPELCANLERLYDYVRSLLLGASARMDATPLAEAERQIIQLQAAFSQAAGTAP